MANNNIHLRQEILRTVGSTVDPNTINDNTGKLNRMIRNLFDGISNVSGTPGSSATITIGTTTTGAAGSSAEVTNSGTSSAAILNFTIPQGAAGEAGPTGATGATGATGPQGIPGPQQGAVLGGFGPPIDSQGADTDWFLDLNSLILYGPKSVSWFTSPQTQLDANNQLEPWEYHDISKDYAPDIQNSTVRLLNTDIQRDYSKEIDDLTRRVVSINDNNPLSNGIPTSVITGVLPIINGGTGQSTATAAYNALSPMTTLGDIEYENSTPGAVRLAGNTSTTTMYLSQTGNGTISAAPSWQQPSFSQLSGSATSSQLPSDVAYLDKVGGQTFTTAQTFSAAITVNAVFQQSSSSNSYFAGTGFLGLGTNNPQALFHAYSNGGSTEIRAETQTTGGATTVRLKANGTGGGNFYWQTGDNASGLNGRFRLYDAGTSGGERISVFATTGNIGFGITSDNSTDKMQINGSTLTTGIHITSGSNTKTGTGTLSGGTITISNVSVTTHSYIFLTKTSTSANSGELSYSVSAGTGFTVTSTNSSDGNSFVYLIVETS
jgi:hypothetical protein